MSHFLELAGGSMFRHRLLKLLLVLHFLPWPGRDTIIFLLESPAASGTSGEVAGSKGRKDAPVSVVHQLFAGNDELVVYFELDHERTEKEEKNERDDDTGLDMSLVWLTPIEIKAVKSGIVQSWFARFFSLNILSTYQILRC